MRTASREERPFWLQIPQALVPGGGVEPPRGCPRRILSPLRLPVPPSRPGARPRLWYRTGAVGCDRAWLFCGWHWPLGSDSSGFRNASLGIVQDGVASNQTPTREWIIEFCAQHGTMGCVARPQIGNVRVTPAAYGGYRCGVDSRAMLPTHNRATNVLGATIG